MNEKQGVRYWVYENWVNDKAFVHESTCQFCNDGEGFHGVSVSNDGAWHGSFGTAEEALQFARNTGRGHVRSGKCCHPI